MSLKDERESKGWSQEELARRMAQQLPRVAELALLRAVRTLEDGEPHWDEAMEREIKGAIHLVFEE